MEIRGATRQLNGRVAIVTGGGTGIGRGVALALARAGAKVVICGRRSEELKQTSAAITQTGGNALTVQADISKVEDVDRLVKATLEAYGAVDILINNAGIGGGDAIHQHDVEDWDQVIAVNLRGPFLLARAVLPIMRAQRRGEIVNLSSESGLEYYPGDGAYGISKHALNALSEYIQRENQDSNIRVNTICPGMVVTEMTEGTSGLDETKCLYPEDIADLVIWLLTRRPNIKIGRPILIQTMLNPWE
ncbi:MAG TPA: SDR family oxidoreductase [Anaerolineae bacterium]|nr:SDR family oxidoreductase [Anaerolineae bacterium]